MRLLLALMLVIPLGAQPKYSNLQILKMPEDDLIPYMLTFNEGLGVRCAYCHDPHSFAADDYKTKETARRMITMVQELNAKFPAGKTRITCYTCHRVETTPLMAPPAN